MCNHCATMTDFASAVTRVVADLQPGELITYAEVAAEAGRPGAARAVGAVLKASAGLAWWRVVRADGTLPLGAEQARLLAGEGITVTGGRVHTTATAGLR